MMKMVSEVIEIFVFPRFVISKQKIYDQMGIYQVPPHTLLDIFGKLLYSVLDENIEEEEL